MSALSVLRWPDSLSERGKLRNKGAYFGIDLKNS